MGGNDFLGLGAALGMEAFVTIHMCVFVLLPLSTIISKDNSKKVFWILFGIRAAILLFFNFFITTGIAIIDFMAVFVGAFIVLPLSTKIGAGDNKKARAQFKALNIPTANLQNNAFGVNPQDKAFGVNAQDVKKAVKPTDFDPIFSLKKV